MKNEEKKYTEKEIETMRLFIAETLLCLSSGQSRSNPVHMDDLAAKAACFMTGREACEIIQSHDRSSVDHVENICGGCGLDITRENHGEECN